MLIRKKGPRELGLNEPIRHGSHKRPVTRRDFIAQGFLTGPAVITAPTVFSLFANPRAARAALSNDLAAMKTDPCNIKAGAGKIPFICFDLAGGANLVGSEVLVGKQGGQLDFLSTAGYGRLGLPGDMVPNSGGATTFINTSLGLAWHSDGAMLRGILEKASVTTQANTNGAVIAARSENDTANNPHNPMYGIHRCGADGELLTLIGSRSSDSGGNSMAPLSMINPEVRPTKVDRASDVTGLVDTGELATLFQNTDDAIAVMESMARLSHDKVGRISPRAFPDARRADLERLVKCGYIKSADLADRFRSPSDLDPGRDELIVGPTGIFTQAEYNGDEEFRKTAAVMKMVIDGYAGAGTITMGGYDYHGQGRATGEIRNLRAGRCIGACLEYAARTQTPLMIYIFSDGSLNSDNSVDTSPNGRGKFNWVSDNQSTAASIILVYNPRGRPELFTGGNVPPERHQQIGFFRADGSVDTGSHPGANAVNLLVEIVLLNYLALHNENGLFDQPGYFPTHGLGNSTMRDSLTAFAPIVDGVITQPL